MSDSINPVKNLTPHVLTFAPLRVVFKACDTSRRPQVFVSRQKQDIFFIMSDLFNPMELYNYNRCRKPSRDEAKYRLNKSL